MSFFKRASMAVLLAACVPFVTAGGGINPPPFQSVMVSPFVDAVVVMDPHETLFGPVTTTAKQASIWLSRSGKTAGAVFDVPLFGFPLFFGCDLDLTDDRFVNNGGTPVPLENWMPADLVASLFAELGLPVTPTKIPAMRRIKAQRCTPDPNPDNNTDGVPNPGFLVFEAEIGFLIPRR
jgi:hypothetical protein